MQTLAEAGSQRSTFLRIVEEYGPALQRLVNAYVRGAEDRQDLLQEIATELWKALPKFRGDSSERTWLYRIAHNIAITWSIRVHRRQARGLSEEQDYASPERAEQSAIENQRRAWMLSAIRELPEDDRQVIVLHLEGLSYAEIEQVTGLSQNVIGTRLSRIRDRLANTIREKEGG